MGVFSGNLLGSTETHKRPEGKKGGIFCNIFNSWPCFPGYVLGILMRLLSNLKTWCSFTTYKTNGSGQKCFADMPTK
jgi:hypothetical protein